MPKIAGMGRSRSLPGHSRPAHNIASGGTVAWDQAAMDAEAAARQAAAEAAHQQAVGIYNSRVAARLGTEQPIDDSEVFKLLNRVREARPGASCTRTGTPAVRQCSPACGEQPANPCQPLWLQRSAAAAAAVTAVGTGGTRRSHTRAACHRPNCRMRWRRLPRRC